MTPTLNQHVPMLNFLSLTCKTVTFLELLVSISAETINSTPFFYSMFHLWNLKPDFFLAFFGDVYLT